MQVVRTTLAGCLLAGLMCATIAAAVLPNQQVQTPIHVESLPPQIGVLHSDGTAVQLESFVRWKPICGSAPGSVTIDDLRRTAEKWRARRQNNEPLDPPAEGGGTDVVFNLDASVPAAAVTAIGVVETYLESVFSDNVTYTIDVDFANLGGGILGQTGSFYASASFATTRNGLQNGQDGDDTIQDFLPATSTIPIRYDGTTSTVTNEGTVFVTRANYRAAIGSTGGTAASMTFNSTFSWDYTPPSIGAGQYCFQSVLVHEVGHAMGFTSNADNTSGPPFDQDIDMLDIFRFQRTDGAGDFNPDTTAEFTTTARLVDYNTPNDDHNSDVISIEYRMEDGDPSQASHFRESEIGIMDPTLAPQETFSPNFFKTPDITMFDAIGWDYPLCFNPCSDGNNCTTGDACSNGVCVGTPVDCTAMNTECSTFSCNPPGPAGNCDNVVHDPNGTACDDGLACTIPDTCNASHICTGPAVNCSSMNTDCATFSCDPGGADGNCDISSPFNEGMPCSSGTGTCGSGVCVRTRVFMARLGEQASAPPIGATTLEMEPGTTAQVDVWLRDGAGSQLLNGYQIMIPWNATLVSGSGMVQYVDVPPTGSAGDSVRVDTTRSDWVFTGQPLQAINYQEIVNSRSGFIYNLSASSGINASPLGIRYLGQIAVASQAGACGEFSLPFRLTIIPVSQLFIPLGNIFNVDLFQPLSVIVGSPNDDCADSIPLSGINVVRNFDSTCATQDGAAHAGCDLDKDIWYKYTATCTGEVTVDTLAGCSFDSDLAVYEDGAACIPGDGDLVSCSSTPGACESITIPVIFGDSLLIRVGSAAGAFGPGTLTVHCESILGPCDEAADCADINFNTVRDDPCVWWSCNASTCQGTNVLFADMGGVNGICIPDGSADVNDKFHALNCFSDTNFGMPGEYPCEPEGPVSVYNVDAGGAGLTCCPDGACDANDAFAALNAFSGTSLCAVCPQNTAVCVGGGKAGIPCGNDDSCAGGSCVIQNPTSHPCPPPSALPSEPGTVAGLATFVDAVASQPVEPARRERAAAAWSDAVVGNASLSVVASRRVVAPGELVSVDVVLGDPVTELRGYQLHLDATGGRRGHLNLVDIAVRKRPNAVFSETPNWEAFNVVTQQMLSGLDGAGVPVPAGSYLATFTYRATLDAAGTFVVDAMIYEPATPDRRSFLFGPGARPIVLSRTTPAAVVVNTPPGAAVR